MHAIWMMKRGGTEVLKVREASDPHTGVSEVRIRVKASGLNFADIMARLGLSLKPVIDSRYPFSRVAEAHQRIEQRKNIGKILLTPD